MIELQCCVLYMKAVKRVNPKKSHHKGKKILFLIFVCILDDEYSLNL